MKILDFSARYLAKFCSETQKFDAFSEETIFLQSLNNASKSSTIKYSSLSNYMRAPFWTKLIGLKKAFSKLKMLKYYKKYFCVVFRYYSGIWLVEISILYENSF